MKRVAMIFAAGGLLAAAAVWAQTGLTVEGEVVADGYVGDGSQLTGLDAPGTTLDSRINDVEVLLLALENEVTASTTSLRADLLCRSGAVRYLDLGNGTVFDCQQKLQWLKDATCLGNHTWAFAKNTVIPEFNDGTSTADCADYVIGTYDDWRQPTKSQWEDAAADADALGCSHPNFTSDLGARLVDDFPTDGVAGWVGTCGTDENLSFVLPASTQWTFHSSSVDSTDANFAWVFALGSGNLNSYDKGSARHVWAVRGGQ